MNRILLLSLTIAISASCALGQVVPIHDIQYTQDPSGNSPYSGQVVSTGGIVTAVNYTAQPMRYFIADRAGGLWSGVFVFDTQDRHVAIGDSVSFQAEVQESNTQTRLRNIVSGTFASVAASGTVLPIVVTCAEVVEASEGVLIELHEAVVTAVGSGQFTVNDGTGAVTIGNGWSYAYVPMVGDTLRFVRGIVTSASYTFTLNPRDDTDFSFTGNRPPLISNVQNSPATPTELQSDTISAAITDEQGVQSATISYRFGTTGDFILRPMYDNGQNGDAVAGDGRWTGVVPAGPARGTCYYYITATDSEGSTGTLPSDAPASLLNYSIRSSVLGIYDIQYTGNPSGGTSPYDGDIVTLTGIVTGTNFGDQRDGFFMCDPGGGPWTGILVFGPSLTPALGDCVRVNGQITEYYDLTEITSGNTVTVLGRGTVPAPMDISIGILPDSAEAYEGALVHIGTCRVTNISDWMSYQQFDVQDASGTGTILGDFGLEYVPVVGDSFTSITGCVTYHSAVGWMIAPRNDADMGIVDRRPPELVSAASVSDTAVNVVFNERLSDAGLGNLSNYHIISQTDFSELHVLSVNLFRSGKTLQINVLEELNDSAYQVIIDTVRDVAGNAFVHATAEFAGYEPGEYTPIADIYNDFDAFNNVIVTLRGIINHMQDVTTSSGSRRISAYIQDNSWRIINGDTMRYGLSLSQSGAASTFPGIQRGNLITITGTVTAYQGAIQLGTFTAANVTVLAENAPMPKPMVFRTGDRTVQKAIIWTSSEGNYGGGTWCQTAGTIYQVDENVGGGTNMYIDDGSGNITMRIWDSMNLDSVQLDSQWYMMRELVGKNCTILGPSSAYNGDFQMLGGYAEDFVSSTPDIPPEHAGEEFYLDVPNRPFAPDLGQRLHIDYNAPVLGEVRLRVFDLRGRVVTTLVSKNSGGHDTIDWDGRDQLRELLPMGTYILHLESVKDGASKTKIKPVVIGTKL